METKAWRPPAELQMALGGYWRRGGDYGKPADSMLPEARLRIVMPCVSGWMHGAGMTAA